MMSDPYTVHRNHRHADSALQALFDEAIDKLTRLDNAHGFVVNRMRDWQDGQPGAQNLDGMGGGRTEIWCDIHERSVFECYEHCALHGRGLRACVTAGETGCRAFACTGVPIEVADVTGEAAIKQDQARLDEEGHRKDVEALHKLAVRMVERAQRYTSRGATARQRREVEAENRRDPWCESCSRIDDDDGKPHLTVPVVEKPTNVAGRLDAEYLLCRWCRDVVVITGRLPFLNELRVHASGKRVQFQVNGKEKVTIG